MQMSDPAAPITGETVREDFNSILAVIHYAKAAHTLGLWQSERALIEATFPDRAARLLEAGCGAGRVTIGLWHLGYRQITAFDFAAQLVEQAASLAEERGATGLRFLEADATRLSDAQLSPLNSQQVPFDGVLFMFNGLMQIPGRTDRRAALRGLRELCRAGAPILFTTHDRDDPRELVGWKLEAERWTRGEQDSRLREFGDRYFTHEHGNTFMHLPDRREVLEDLAATGWAHQRDATRDDLARESEEVRAFSDNCRFWVAEAAAES